MESSVALVSQTTLNVAGITSIARHVLGRDLATSIDRANVKSNLPLAHLSILDSLTSVDVKEVQSSARNASPSTLDHLHFSFIIASDPRIFAQLTGLCSRTLAITTSETGDLGIISGTLKEWKLILGWNLTAQTPPKVRDIFSKCFGIFESQGLGEVWSGFQKRYVDKILVLEPR